MIFPRYKATVRTAEKPGVTDNEDPLDSQLADVSIIAAIAVALGLSGRLTALITHQKDLLRD